MNQVGYFNTQKVNKQRIQDLTEDVQNLQGKVDLYFIRLISTRVQMNKWMGETDQRLSLRKDEHALLKLFWTRIQIDLDSPGPSR